MKKIMLIPSLISEDWGSLKALIIVLVVLYACVFLSVIIDLFFGIKRAKRLKIARTSFGYRRTITKLTSYFGLLLMLTIADVAASIILNMPYFTVIGAIGIVIVEAKSVFENIHNEEKSIAEVQKVMFKLFENKEQIQSLISFLKSNNSNTSNKQEDKL